MSDLSELPVASVASNPLIVQPHPFSAAHIDGAVPNGLSIAQIVDQAGLPSRYRRHVRVWVDDHELHRDLWATARPKAGRVVVIKVFPHGGGGGKNPLAVVLSIALMIVAPYAGAALAQAWGLGAATLGLGLSTAVWGSAIGMGIGLVGSLAINALLPPPAPPGHGQTAPAYQITGSSNAFQPYAPIPRVLGRRRIYPIMAARPYTESQGNDQYIRLLLLAGYGPLQISDIKIGETPITAFAGVEIEVTQGGPDGWAGNTPITLYTQAIREDSVSTELTAANGWQLRTTRTDTSEISLDITFPRGLITYNTNGTRAERSVSVDVQYRLVGSGTWLTPAWSNSVEPGMAVDGTITATDTSQNAVVRSGRFKVAAAGQYEVQCSRTTAVGGDHDVDNSYWSVLRSIQHQPPVNQKQVCLIAVRIKASEQLNGVPNSINCLAESYLPVYSGFAWNWQITRNPAWAYADILRRRGAETLIPDNRIDLDGLLVWAAACAAIAPNAAEPYWVYDSVVEGGSVFNAVHDILSHARAGYTMRDGKHSVVMDSPQTVPVQHITPRNSWSYSGSKTFLDLPHALLVKFTNEDKGYAEDQITVYADGYSEANATLFETIEYYGCTRSTQAWRIGRYLHAVGQLRPELHTVYMDIESLRCTNGDLVRFAHDVILVGLGSGRVRSVSVNISNQVTALTLDGPVTMATGTSYGLRVRKADGSSVVAAVATVAGEHDSLTLTSPIPVALAPAAGDLFQFGESGLESAPMLVKKIERGPGLTAKITLIDAQPGVWTADGGTIPPFNSYITVPTPQAQRQPLPPSFTLRSDDVLLLSDGTVQDQILVTIYPPAPSSVSIAEYEVQFKLSEASSWAIGSRASSDLRDISLSPVLRGASYDVRARSISPDNLSSYWVYSYNNVVVGITGIFVPPALPAVTGLELINGGTSRIFTGRDAKFQWRSSSSSLSYNIGSEPFGASSGSNDPTFKDYEVRILNATTGAVIRTEHVVDPYYTYTFEKNFEDTSGSPNRTFEIAVYRRGTFNQLSTPPALLTVSNPAPDTPTGAYATGGPGLATVGAIMPNITDFAGMLIWMSDSTGFTPGPSNQVYDGINNLAVIPNLAAKQTYYFRVAFYDTFGKAVGSLNLSSEMATTTVPTGIPSVTTLPVVGMSIGDVVYLTTDKKLYRYGTTGWITWTDGSDILAHSVTAGQIAALTITANEVAAGTLTGNKIAGNTIVGANIAGSTITGTNIAGNTIQASHMVTGTITAASAILANASVTTLTIAGNAVTIPASASATAAITIPFTSAGDMVSIGYTPQGGTVSITVTLSYQFYAGSAATYKFILATLVKNGLSGTALFQTEHGDTAGPTSGETYGTMTITVLDNPPAGVPLTYGLWASYWCNGSGAAAAAWARTIVVMETLR